MSMKKYTVAIYITVLILFISCMPCHAGTYSSVQSPARPFGLDIVDQVQIAGSDAAAADFQNNTLPTMRDWGNMDLTSPSFTDLTSTVLLDPSKIKLVTDYDVRVYLVDENTNYKNTLGFNTSGGGITSGDPLLIFPDASTGNKRKSNTPLLSGDFVDLGTLTAGTQMDFFLIANGAKGWTDVFSTDESINPDGLDHVLAFARPDSPYLFIGFEDLNGSTNPDYKDSLFAVDIGSLNVESLTNMPEPATLFILSSFIGLVVYRKKRLDQ